MYADTEEDREDLTQEIITELWRSYGSYAGRAAEGTWLYRVAVNVGIHHLKRERRRRNARVLPAEHSAVTEPEAVGPADPLAALRPYIAHLSRIERSVLWLHLEEKSYAEIARITGLTETNVGSRLTRIREKLRQLVNPPKP